MGLFHNNLSLWTTKNVSWVWECRGRCWFTNWFLIVSMKEAEVNWLGKGEKRKKEKKENSGTSGSQEEGKGCREWGIQTRLGIRGQNSHVRPWRGWKRQPLPPVAGWNRPANKSPATVVSLARFKILKLPGVFHQWSKGWQRKSTGRAVLRGLAKPALRGLGSYRSSWGKWPLAELSETSGSWSQSLAGSMGRAPKKVEACTTRDIKS